MESQRVDINLSSIQQNIITALIKADICEFFINNKDEPDQ